MYTYAADKILEERLEEVEKQLECPLRLSGKLYEALQTWMEAHKADVIAQINQTGEYDPDY